MCSAPGRVCQLLLALLVRFNRPLHHPDLLLHHFALAAQRPGRLRIIAHIKAVSLDPQRGWGGARRRRDVRSLGSRQFRRQRFVGRWRTL
ncbi:hypothetical protein C8Q72DRAFT_456742 [Fomitopsis betulina]|nr:hypothetical protein C8Q72DRAFT_456742 [Fomitopsis betulina]